jgi:hypothetical protein
MEATWAARRVRAASLINRKRDHHRLRGNAALQVVPLLPVPSSRQSWVDVLRLVKRALPRPVPMVRPPQRDARRMNGVSLSPFRRQL